MQASAYATFGRGANLTAGPLSQSRVQQQPLGVLADSSKGEWLSPLHRETGRPWQKTDAIYRLQGQRQVSSTRRKAINCRRNCPTRRFGHKFCDLYASIYGRLSAPQMHSGLSDSQSNPLAETGCTSPSARAEMVENTPLVL